MQKSRMKFEIKEVAPDGSFEGILAIYNQVDLGGDLIEPGAFRKTIADHGNQVPMLWQHKTDQPIGMLTLTDTPDALRVKGQLLMDLPDARNAYLLIKNQIVKGLSIGFDTVKKEVTAGVRHLKEIRLWEGSVVTFNMDPFAVITSVKQRGAKAADVMDACQALCRICSSTVEQALYYCYDAGGDMVDQVHIGAMADCISCCEFCCGAMYRDSASVAQVCALCEVICRQCAEACGAFVDDAVMLACVEACESCADACAAMGAGAAADMQTMGLNPLERKAGRVISAATKRTLRTAHDHQKSALDIVLGLMQDESEEEDVAEEGKAAGQILSSILDMIPRDDNTKAWRPGLNS